MSATAIDARSFTLAQLHAIVHGPIKDRSYLATRLGADVQAFLAWKRLGRAQPRTLDQYERDLARLALAIPDKTLEQVDITDLMLLLDLIPEGSWQRFRAAWNGLFRWGQRFGRRPDNPCDQLPALKKKSPPVHPIFDVTEQQALLNGCVTSLLPTVDYARVLTMNDTGTRKGEARTLQLKDFDLRERAVLLHGKGGKDRLVPIRAELVSAIDRLMFEPLPTLRRPLRPADHLWFPWHVSRLSDGRRQLNRIFPARPMSERGFHEWWKRRVEEGEVEYRKPHMTRHTYATDLLDADANPHDVKELLGHADMRTTEVYLHSSRKRLNRATDKLSAYRSEG